jgi:hypothetical protein
MKAILNLICLTMLLLSGTRLALVGAKELQRYRYNRNENALTIKIGSFVGIDTEGDEKKPDLDDNGHLLLFVLHHNRIHSDIQFWNHVIILAGQARPQVGGHIQYWGVCDSGAECNPHRREADFTILGYLEPFEMRIVSAADARDEALLYDHRNVLDARIARAVCPMAQANLILGNAK